MNSEVFPFAILLFAALLTITCQRSNKENGADRDRDTTAASGIQTPPEMNVKSAELGGPKRAPANISDNTGGSSDAPSFTQAFLDEWCKKSSKPRRWGPKGHYDSVFPSLRAGYCRDRFTFQVKSYHEAKENSWPYFKVHILHLADNGETETVYEFKVNYAEGWGAERLMRFTVGDIDGDKTAEVFFGIYMHEEGYFEWKAKLLTLKDHKLVSVSLPNGYRAQALKDVDDDGLFDVFINGPYQDITYDVAIGGKQILFWRPGLFLMHALGDGTFSMTDDVAKRIAKKRCPQKVLPWREYPAFCDTSLYGDTEQLEKKRTPHYGNPQQLICSMVYGARSAKLIAKFKAQCNRGEDSAYFDALLEILKSPPPVRLP